MPSRISSAATAYRSFTEGDGVEVVSWINHARGCSSRVSYYKFAINKVRRISEQHDVVSVIRHSKSIYNVHGSRRNTYFVRF